MSPGFRMRMALIRHLTAICIRSAQSVVVQDASLRRTWSEMRDFPGASFAVQTHGQAASAGGGADITAAMGTVPKGAGFCTSGVWRRTRCGRVDSCFALIRRTFPETVLFLTCPSIILAAGRRACEDWGI